MCYYLQVMTAVGDKREAQTIASTLVREKMAACVQIVGPVECTYRWQGVVESAEEWLCMIKTTSDHYDRIEEAIHRLHSYDEPEIISLPIAGGAPGYLRWIRSVVETHETPNDGNPVR